jgi:alpha-galactosidase
MKHRQYVTFAFALFLLQAFLISSAPAVDVNREEQAEAKRWVAAKFNGKIEPVPAVNYLTLMDGRGTLQRNARGTHEIGEGVFREGGGRPLRISNTQYARGLYLNGTRGVVVHLTSAAKTFEAIGGIDGSYAGCGYTNGSQEFSIKAGDNVVFPPAVVKVAAAGIPIKAELAGATEFTLQNGQDPQKEWCGEAVWADARVTLQNGNTVWLGDLPLGPLAEPLTSALPFSFTYGGKSSAELLTTWRRQRAVRQLDENRTEYDTTFQDPDSGLVVRWTGVEYHDFPVVEWTLYFENTGSADTPILENIRAVDTWFQRNTGDEFVLHHFRGSPAMADDFEPFELTLTPKIEKHIATSGGRPTDHALCYFNIDQMDKGVIVGLGWPGQWAADFSRDDGRGVRVQAGQELTHFKLLPGEKVRSPMTALLFWTGDWVRGQNVWRKWMLAHNLPRPGGKPLAAKLAASSAPWYMEMSRADEASQKLFLDRYHQENININYWWMDAGWYVSNGTWPNTGTWEIDPKRFPNGFRPVDDHAHSMGVQSIVWFELERVTRDSWLWEKHPDWLLKSEMEEQHGQRLLNLGNPEAVKWVVDYLDTFITQQAVDVYRIDFNIAPLPFWRETDAPDRQGITENKYVMGFLEYLDQLKKRHPEILIDTCASGGRRDDLETLRRAVPMHRSDYSYEPVGQQNITYGMSFWIPYYGSPNAARDNYVFRSSWGPQINVVWDVRRKDLDYEWIRRATSQWRSVADLYLGDYYPLTTYDSSDIGWIAWQFDRPERGEGMVQAFRRSNSVLDSAQLILHGLQPDSRYEVKNVDESSSQQLSGRELMQNGLTVSLKDRMSSAVITYKRSTPK